MEPTTLEPNISSDAAVTKPLAGGELRLHEFASRIFRNQRFLRVWLPAGYDQPENAAHRYPVFYLNDGQNLFESSTSFTGIEWRVGETASRMIEQKLIPPMIFVGIDNAREERLKEYVPYRSVNPPVLRPRGDKFPEFLLREAMPFLEKRYRIARGPENTALGGSSLGGLMTLYVVLAMPGVFGYALLESPSLWVANRKILRECRGFRSWPQKYFWAWVRAKSDATTRICRPWRMFVSSSEFCCAAASMNTGYGSRLPTAPPTAKALGQRAFLMLFSFSSEKPQVPARQSRPPIVAEPAKTASTAPGSDLKMRPSRQWPDQRENVA